MTKQIDPVDIKLAAKKGLIVFTLENDTIYCCDPKTGERVVVAKIHNQSGR